MSMNDKKDKRVDASDPKIRVPGEKGSSQNELRGELYSSAFSHIKDAYDKGFYIECISIIDSMITDRIESYCQFLSYEDDKQFVANSVFDAIRNLGTLTKEKGVRDDEFYVINDKIEKWSAQRNRAIHGFVIVREETKGDDFNKRKQVTKDAADEGLRLVREVMSYTQKRIRLPKGLVPTQSLQEILEEELAEGFGEDDPVVQNLRRQIDAEERNASSEEMYGNAPFERE